MSAKNAVGLLNDFSKGLAQQLFYWGRDVVHPRGNLLCEFGFEKYKRQGVSGSSCYKTSFNGDIIELHSFCVGRYSQNTPSLLYTRQDCQCWVYKDDQPPPPGQYDPDLVNKSSIEKLEVASRNFLEWWLEYELWIADHTHPNYRTKCYTSYKQFGSSKTWLNPQDGLSWLQKYMDSPDTLIRSKHWKKSKNPNALKSRKPNAFRH